jgi:ligand-binding sensor domain-containing protein
MITATGYPTAPSTTFIKMPAISSGSPPGMASICYDGNTFHVFNYSKENDFKSIGSNVIRQVTEDKKGNIWVTTIEGISRYEKQSGRFYNYFYSQNQQGRVSEQEYALVTDTAGNVWCLDQKTGLNWYDASVDSFRNVGTLIQKTPVSRLTFDAATASYGHWMPMVASPSSPNPVIVSLL